MKGLSVFTVHWHLFDVKSFALRSLRLPSRKARFGSIIWKLGFDPMALQVHRMWWGGVCCWKG